MTKRIFDLVSALFGILILLPLFALISLLIKLDSKGPVFFRQTRVGQFGVPFRIHKFRTMTENSEKSGRLTIGNDLRITRIGRFLRKSKLDELPQLIDVLLGKMSIVGPRPEVPEFIMLYPIDTRNEILSVRPGISDKASIEMIDENEILAKYSDPRQAYIDIILPIKQTYYVEYSRKHSFFGDILIILKTIQKIIFR